jgi:hypothetical protein
LTKGDFNMRSIKLGMATVSLLMGTALFLPAQATGDDESCQNNSCNTNVANGGEGGMGGEGGTGVGYGGEANATARAVNNNVNAAHGGNAHARGGHSNATGGDASATGGNATGGNATGGSATGGSANNSSVNSSSNSLTSNNDNINNANNSTSATGGSASANNNGNNNGNNNSSSSNHQSQSANNDNANSNNSDQSVEVNTYNQRPPVSTAYAAQLTTGEDTCMGSSSIGAQAVNFGLSLGTTWQDDNCRRLKNSRQLVALGFHRAATALMCVDEDVRAAMIAAGTPCPNGEMAAAVAVPPARHYVMMAPVADKPAAKHKQRKKRKALPPK